ncbi:MAG: HD domain-containing protein [Oscillospiraceae bacterium]|nr:HD domain-containing protein [Oscillospiraceae bacterium]
MRTSRHSLIFGLSYALDIAGKNNLSHSKSTAYISVMIGRKLGFTEDKLIELYYAALLHDIALSTKYEMEQHCVDGREMLSKLPLPGDIAEIVYYHHETNDGTGIFHTPPEKVPVSSQIICFTSAFDDKFGKKSDTFNRDLFLEVEEWLEKYKRHFSEEIVAAFEDLLKYESFLLDYSNHETKFNLSSKIVIDDDVYYDCEDITKFARCFADIIDKKSPFTYTHSLGIAEHAKLFAAYLGYDETVQDTMYIAGLLHDIGKLDVSVDILHKEDKLSPDERYEINKHTYYTRKVLEQIEGFEKIVEYAANHHEKIDGTGYPYRIPGERMSELERAMAICDVYQALTEHRPYRAGLSAERVWGIIDGMAERGHLDPALVVKAKEAFAGDELG